MRLFSKLNTGFVLDSLGYSVVQILTGSFSPSHCFLIYFVNSFLTLNNISGRPHSFLVPFGYLNIQSRLGQFKNLIYKSYSTGSYIQYPVINHDGKSYKKECVCVYITESLCCTEEINTTM